MISSVRNRWGFTLIELLVVIAIIAILAAILFPVFAQAREKARQAACLSNTKQLGLALLQYAQDYDEFFPVRYGSDQPAEFEYGFQRTWKNMMMPYIKSREVFRCPSNPTARRGDLVWNGTDSTDGYFPGGYSFYLPDAWLCEQFGHGCGYPQSIAGIEYPADALVILETSWRFPDTGPYLGYWEPAPSDWKEITPGPSTWNSGHSKRKSNIIYFDGHAKYKSLRSTFNETNGINEWRFNKADADAKDISWVYSLLTGLEAYPGE